MHKRRMKVDNNLLALLAIALMISSSFNITLSIMISESRHASSEGMSTGNGIVRLCAGIPPNITADTYHEVEQDTAFFHDVNATGESNGTVIYSDNVTMFNITSSGFINFTPSNDDVGLFSALITATETDCGINDYEIVDFNVTNKNDPPELISLIFENSTANNTYDFYSDPSPPYLKIISGQVHIWEDVWYNATLDGDDPDLYNPNSTESLRYGKIPPALFVLDVNDGNVTFMPVQSEVGSHSFLFSIIDNDNEVEESDWVTVIVHNTNDHPVLLNKTVLAARTTPSGLPYVLDVNATDEDGDTLVYDVDFLDCDQIFRNITEQNCSVFEINSSSGLISFTPLLVETGNYTLNYTVTDGQGGVDYQVGNFTVVENTNQPPNITEWWPIPPVVAIIETYSQMFNITVVDPDSGINSVSTEWHVNGTVVAINTFTYTFYTDYTSSGIYNVTVIVNDGWVYDPQTDSHEWTLVVTDRNPPDPGASKGASRGPPTCLVNWRCTDWAPCTTDGYQTRVCIDLSMCRTDFNKPPEIRNCTYSPNPTCFDGILNCHDGLCEVLTDCGGPCSSCPTCSDGIKNCHVNGKCEEDMDCGGPCPPCIIPPHVAVCGNGICEAGELNACLDDCFDFWVDIVIFLMIIILLIIVSILLYIYRKETVLLYVYRRMKGE